MAAGVEEETREHATTVELSGVAVMLRGRSGAGKSDLAIRLIDAGARLVADDQTVLVRRGDALWAMPPASIAGKLEVRGLGIAPVPAVAEAPLGLVVDLVAAGDVERLPAPATAAYLGVDLPLIAVDPRAPSAVARLRLAARLAAQGMLPGHERRAKA